MGARADGLGTPRAPARAMPAVWPWALMFATVVCVALVLLALRLAVAEPFRVTADSMAPTLRAGERVLVDKRAYRGASAPRRGDLAVFRAPSSGQVLLKRVVAVAGDVFAIEDGVVSVNGRARNEPYADSRALESVWFGPVTVGPGSVFVLGDNLAKSEDSRSFGPVPTESLIGRVIARIWPPGRWGSAG